MAKKNLTYTQCVLEKTTSPGVKLQTVSWLPTKFSRVGNTVSLKNSETDEWTHDWKVVEKGQTKESDETEERSRDYLKHREFSDI